MTSKIKGSSGASLQFLIDDTENKIVRKTCHNEKSKRLLVQAEKQRSFNKNIFKVPEIFRITQEEDSTILEMSFIDGSDMVSYTCYSELQEFIVLTEKIIDFLSLEIQESCVQKFPMNTWMTKVNSLIETDAVKKKVSLSFLKDCSTALIENLPERIHIGKCHGDLTFSNMLVMENNIYLIDFLDPPIETPYEDISKIMIDCRYFWTLQKYSEECDKTKVKILWEHIGRRIEQRLSCVVEFSIIKKFQLLGLLRILPYTSDVNEIKLIVNSMKDVMNDIDITLCR